MKGSINGKFPRTPDGWVLMDWDGEFNTEGSRWRFRISIRRFSPDFWLEFAGWNGKLDFFTMKSYF